MPTSLLLQIKGSKAQFIWSTKVVLLYPDISNFTFWNVKIQNVKNFLIDFLDELGNFKQKNFYTSKCKILQPLSYVESTIVYPLRKSGKKRNHKLEWMDDALEDLMKDSMTEYSGRIHRKFWVQNMESSRVPEEGSVVQFWKTNLGTEGFKILLY